MGAALPWDEAWLADYRARMDGLKSLPALPDSVLFCLPFLLKLPRQTLGRHWSEAARYRKWLRPHVEAAVRPWLGHAPMKKAQITITRVSTGCGVDYDNNVSSTKPLVDLLLIQSSVHPSSLGLIEDDDPARLTRIIRWERCATRKEQRTEIIIERA